MSVRAHGPAAAFTLVELLVVIAIIGLLVALLLPAVQAARETARRSECANHLKQMALGVIDHEHIRGYYPSGGWGWGWVGDPDRGAGLRQPGSWEYSILPYIEEQAIYSIGAGASVAAKQSARAVLAATPCATFNCPSKRSAVPYPWTWRAPTLSNMPTGSGKSDYGINAGSQTTCEFGAGPGDYPTGDNPAYAWNNTSNFTGISYEHSEVKQRTVTDGTSKTYMIGEKYLDPDNYTNGLDGSDNTSMYSGFTSDNYRGSSIPPLPDTPGNAVNHCGFGSAHPGSWNAAFCDGSVHTMSYEIDPTLHTRLGSRADGIVVQINDL
jgi:prepilin-type N-terminal cleavage/methylation domain-containing protein